MEAAHLLAVLEATWDTLGESQATTVRFLAAVAAVVLVQMVVLVPPVWL